MNVHRPYNAWQHQDLGAPWWTLMDKVYRDALDFYEDRDQHIHNQLIARHWIWKLGTGWRPILIGFAVTVIALILFLTILPTGGTAVSTFQAISAIVAGVLALFALKDKLGIVNTRTAEAFLEHANNPLEPLTRRYGEIIAQIDKPVAVFIDDVDRCNADYLVDLLHAIQTLYRQAPVVYVVAGDRDWICSAYEQTYTRFEPALAAPGHSLGHLFLEKLFQVSVEVPRLSPALRQAFWDGLINRGRKREKSETAGGDTQPATAAAPPTTEEIEQARAEKEAQIAPEMAAAHDRNQIRAVQQKYSGDPLAKAVANSLAFERSFSDQIRREDEHMLLKYVDHLESNPRAMKRLLNAYGFRAAYDLQLPEPTDPDALIRWTIFETRWPIWAAEVEKAAVGEGNSDQLAACRNHPEVKSLLASVSWKDISNIVLTSENADNSAVVN